MKFSYYQRSTSTNPNERIRNELYIRTQLGVVRLSHPLAINSNSILQTIEFYSSLPLSPTSVRSTSQHCQFHLHLNRIPPEMSNRPSQSAELTLQPFRLFDLPRELLVPIVRSYRSRIGALNDGGIIIYHGEGWGNERYKVLRELCLAHRDILPFAQEELFKRLDIKSEETMDKLNRSIASSERCKEYASRTESIYWGGRVTGKLIESGAFNPREFNTSNGMMSSILSGSPSTTLSRQR